MLLGIDIGTTNIEFALSDACKGTSFAFMPNPLSSFGLDVMTRINNANNGKLAEMCQCLRKSISDKITQILDFPHTLTEIRIAANTTMIHILMNYTCANLGVFPFSPVHTEAITTDSVSIGLYTPVAVPVYITPGLSAFVGGDIVSGLNILPDCSDFLFIDMGTNAEMVYCKDTNAYITSAAAGPAFETCSYGHATDAIDGLSYMLDNKIIDDTGLLCEEYFDEGFDCNNIHFSQKKIRDFQMAKAAVRAGIELLLRESNNFNESNHSLQIFIAGNFGTNLNIENAIKLGMFPSWFANHTTLLGNTSLKGTLLSDCSPNIYNKNIREVYLANLPDFNDYYINFMNF